MTIRRATEADEAVLRELWNEFEAEVPFPFVEERETWEEEWRDTLDDIPAAACSSPRTTRAPSASPASRRPRRAARTSSWCTSARRPAGRASRPRWCASASRTPATGAPLRISLDVMADNATAREVWRRFGFEELELLLVAPIEALGERLEEKPIGESRASTHVQTDDELSVERAISHFVPRLEAPDVSSNGSCIGILLRDPMCVI